MCMRKIHFPTQFYEDIHFEFYQIIYIILKISYRRHRKMETVLTLVENQVLGLSLYVSSILKMTEDLKIAPSHTRDEGFPRGSAGKESTCNVGDLGLITGLERSPGEGKGYPFQYSGLENSMDYRWGRRVRYD